MSLESTTLRIKNKVGTDSGIGGTIKFNLGTDGVIVVDGTVVPNEVVNVDRPSDCTIMMGLGDLEDMIDGRLDPMSAYSSGKVVFEGDMMVAMKLLSRRS